ncbi:MAG: PEP/pyruvate-binding domain-containing protein [Pirellulaceae bacterium]|nr:PEP/pyruvate-binding domain-containing protein [Pirellulaceae bacterium]
MLIGIGLSSVVVAQGQPPRGPQPPGGGRGGFQPPKPPVLEALDANKDGEISAQELRNAVEALRKLDKNRDGEIAGSELQPAGIPFAGRGGGPGGRGLDPFGGGQTGKKLAPTELLFRDGVGSIPDHATYHKLSYRGEEVMIDTFLAGLEFVKFSLEGAPTEKSQLYFINTKTHRAHHRFGQVAGLPGRGGGLMKGVLVYRPMLKSPSGKPGLYTFEFEPFDSYEHGMVKFCQEKLIAMMPILKGNIGYFPRGERALARYESEKALYEKSGPPVYLDEDLTNTDIAYLPLNLGHSFGRLRVMDIDERPSPRDVVLYRTLPNEMPRTAGIITAVRQTPLSHVNLRAIQDRIPNSFITEAEENEQIKGLVGKFVSYKVTADGYELREATTEEVDDHFASMRPAKPQTPTRDLAVKEIRGLDDVHFKDSASIGVKAANLGAMRTFGLPAGVVPDGAAVPFYFYDEFMKHNDFYGYAKILLANPEFRKSREIQELKLKELRSLIRKGRMPDWMMSALDDLHKSFPAGASLRCRSSTNNEDLPGFSGAGLYGSYTHRADEGHLSKSIKQVFASLWTFRAFEEREFYRVDHFATAMGVLVHPNYKDELANGVAVTDDILYQTMGNYYINSQVGEDLVTNPDEESVPEEILLDWWEGAKFQVMRTSNRVKGDEQVLSPKHIGELRAHLGRIHARFAKLYGRTLEDEKFAMEIEFKITADGKLAIKQARPWVFAPEVSEPPATELRAGGGGAR